MPSSTTVPYFCWNALPAREASDPCPEMDFLAVLLYSSRMSRLPRNASDQSITPTQ